MKRRYVFAGLALVVALTVASTALGGPSLKKLVKKEVAKQLAGKTGPQGPPGQPGTPGQDATHLFAYIGDDGPADPATVVYGSGVTAVDDPAGDSSYTVTFNRSLVNCVVQASEGFGDPAPGTNDAPVGLIPYVNSSFGGSDQVAVFFSKTAGTRTDSDTSFMITALC